jgi:SAM (Sterile alpha motif) domain-containing protein
MFGSDFNATWQVGQTGPEWPVGMLLDLPLDLDDYRPPEHGIGIMDVGAWLRSLGLAQYEALFRQNGYPLHCP